MKNFFIFCAAITGILTLSAAPFPQVPEQNGRSVYRDASGRIQGSAERRGDQVIYRDASGRISGSARISGGQTTFRDASGRISGSAQQHSGHTTYRDASGRVIGTASTTGKSAPGSSSRRPPMTLM